MSAPDVLWLYRSAGLYHWLRRDPGRRIIARSRRPGHYSKAVLWANLRRCNPDHELCRIDDRTFTWTRGGRANLSRPPLTARTPRKHLPLTELRRRL